MKPPENENVNPYQAPSFANQAEVVALPESDAEISLPAKFGNKNYVLRGYPDRLQILDDQGNAFDLPRRPLFAKLINGTIVRHSFRANKSYIFNLSKEDFATLKTWIGRPTYADLCESVGAGNWWPLPLAIIFLMLVLSRPFSLSSILDLVIAALLLVQFAASRIKPHRFIFLLSAFIFVLLATSNVQHIINRFANDDTLSWINVAFFLILCNFSWWWIRQFIAYGAMEPRTE